ncbi:MAG: aminotransferase [Symbiobacterium sp.]|uniref:aminotransferase n=1 Tax=Symbiobacterium sp. TaxID=1971213 RepID=UPI00346495F1
MSLETYPLPALSLAEAAALQWRLVDLIHRHFDGHAILQTGDLGVVPGLGRPRATAQVERVLADLFEAEDAALVRGAGTGAIRAALQALPGARRILVHRAPVYSTTRVTLAAMRLEVLEADFHDPAEVARVAREVDVALVQHARQRMTDRYDIGAVIRTLRQAAPGLPVITDDNYAVCKVPAIGVQLGATASTFSLFKLLGPEGVGCVVGEGALIERIHRDAYSGGTQVQGPEAMEALRSLVYAPVALALQAQVVQEVVDRLNAGEVPGVAAAAVANAQSRVALVQLEEPIADRVLAAAPQFGAAPYPVGAESRYEVSAMFYRASGTFLADRPDLAPYLLRINPMRAGAETVLRVLRQSVEAASKP